MEIVKKLGSFFLEVIQVVVFAIALFLFLYLLVLQPHKIKGNSMQPNFPNQEYLLTDKVTYRLEDPKRGDVIVFKAPGTDGDEYIKRIIGLPGERVSLKNGKVLINSVELSEGYINSSIYTNPGIFLRANQEVVVPKSSYFVLGDNRPFSSDSRSWGFITRDDITGRAWIVYWPAKSAGRIELPNYNL